MGEKLVSTPQLIFYSRNEGNGRSQIARDTDDTILRSCRKVSTSRPNSRLLSVYNNSAGKVGIRLQGAYRVCPRRERRQLVAVSLNRGSWRTFSACYLQPIC